MVILFQSDNSWYSRITNHVQLFVLFKKIGYTCDVLELVELSFRPWSIYCDTRVIVRQTCKIKAGTEGPQRHEVIGSAAVDISWVSSNELENDICGLDAALLGHWRHESRDRANGMTILMTQKGICCQPGNSCLPLGRHHPKTMHTLRGIHSGFDAWTQTNSPSWWNTRAVPSPSGVRTYSAVNFTRRAGNIAAILHHAFSSLGPTRQLRCLPSAWPRHRNCFVGKNLSSWGCEPYAGSRDDGAPARLGLLVARDWSSLASYRLGTALYRALIVNFRE